MRSNHLHRPALLALVSCALLVVCCSCRGLSTQSFHVPQPPRELVHSPSAEQPAPPAQPHLAEVARATAPVRYPVQQASGQVYVQGGVYPLHHPDEEFTPSVPRTGARMPASAYTGVYAGGANGCYTCGPNCCGYHGPWRPPGIPGPWPADEYLCDGGDTAPGVEVRRDFSVRGLHQEDTIVHFDTLDGETEVQESNKCCIYAPRFASVRKTYGLNLYRQRVKGTGVDLAFDLRQADLTRIPDTMLQPLQARGQIGADKTVNVEERQSGLNLDGTKIAAGIFNGFLPYEDNQLIKFGRYDASEKVRLAQAIDAAIVWSHDSVVKVIVAGQHIEYQKGLEGAQQTELYERPPGSPRMRIVKCASRKDALPGEEISFTIRFDNIGDQPVGNVTIIDNLTTRFEYVEGSAECSVAHEFMKQQNEGDTHVLRWEITDELPIGAGGIIRFKVRLR